LAIKILKECGEIFLKVCPEKLASIFITLRNLYDGQLIEEHTRFMIEILFDVQLDQFKEYPAVESGLNIVDKHDQHTHIMVLLDQCDPENDLGKINIQFNQYLTFFNLDIFKYDAQYVFNENKYKKIREKLPDEYNNDENEHNDDGNESNSNTSEIDQIDSSWNSSSTDMVQSTTSSSSDNKENDDSY
jgi:pre-mRNA-splicing factor CWC22